MNVPQQVHLRVPRVLATDAGGQRELRLPVPPDGTLGSLLDRLRETHPVLERRVRDETGAQRRFVNVYVDGVDVRRGSGPATTLTAGTTIEVIQSVAGG